MGVEGKNLRQYNREIKNRPHRKARPVWRSGWDSNPRAVSDKLISSPTSYKQMCVICGRSHPLCCTQTKLYLQGFSDYITKIAPCIRAHKIFSKKRIFEHVGQTSGRFRADIKPTKQPYGQVYCRDIPSS